MSDPNIVVVVARWRTTTAQLGDVLTYVTDLRTQSLCEPGCIGYDVFQSDEDATLLMLVERYRDSSAADSHRKSVHYSELVTGRIVPLLADRHVEIFGEV